MNCPNCRQPFLPEARFCGGCGEGISNAVPQAGSSSLAAIPAGAPPGAWASTAGAPSTGPSSPAKNLLERVKNILLNPKQEWPVIAAETTSATQLYVTYAMPLAGLAVLMSFIRMSVIGISMPFSGSIRTPLLTGLVYAVVSFGFALLGLFLVALVVNALAPTFGGIRDRRQALKVTAYAFTPALVGSVLGLSPILPTLLQLLADFYGMYVLYVGLPPVMRASQNRALGYTATVVICTFLLGIVFMGLAAVSHLGTRAMPGNPPITGTDVRTQGPAAVGNMIGGMLGTDPEGKAGIADAVDNLTKAGARNDSAANAAPPTNNSPSQTHTASPTADSASSPTAAVGGLVTAFGSALGGSQRVEPLDFKSLTAMLPATLSGMRRTDAQGEAQGAMGIKSTSAHADYVSGSGAKIRIEITDLSGIAGFMDVAGALIQSTSSQSDTAYERDNNLNGRSVHEKYDSTSKKGEAGVMLAKRYQVDVSGEGVDMPALEQAMGQVDLAHLESMKDAGTQTK